MNDLVALLRQFRNRRVLVVGDGGKDCWHEMKRGRDFEDGRPTYVETGSHCTPAMAKFVRAQCESLGADAWPVVSDHCWQGRYVCDDGATWGIRAVYPELLPPGVAHRAIRRIPSHNVVIISDYGKGVCTPETCRAIIDAANEHKIPVLIDPARGSDWAKYAGATVIKASDEELPEHEPWNSDRTLVATCGHNGMLLTHGSDDEINVIAIPAHTPAGPHIDAIGCGDICAAVLGLTLAVGAPLLDGCRLAAVIAGMKTQYRGCRAIAAEEVERELAAQMKAATG